MTRTLSGRGEPTAGAGTEDVLAFAVLTENSSEFPLYWIKFDSQTINEEALKELLSKILVDPVNQTALCERANKVSGWQKSWRDAGYVLWAEKQFLPGVTDNLSHTIEEALHLKGISGGFQVASGHGYLIGREELDNAKQAFLSSRADQNQDASGSLSDLELARQAVLETSTYNLFHPLVETFLIHRLDETGTESYLSFPQVVLPEPQAPETVDLDLDDAALINLSRDRLLALTLSEMKAIRDYYLRADVVSLRQSQGLPKMPTDVELEVLAQTWSEHCKHKIFNANIEYTETITEVHSSGAASGSAGGSSNEEPARTHTRSIRSLYKTFIKGATARLAGKRPDLLSVFEDNSGVVRWSDDWSVCFKVETHNSPSALEPYGGALTGILGVNRDILGTGLGAKPIFNTDIFCFAYPHAGLARRPKLLPPEAIPKGVRKGVEDGGNKSGIPTVNGAIFFDDSYRAKPLVFCGTGGLLPIERNGVALYKKHTKPGDRVVMVGGRVGRDGIHGATFSSESMHEGSPVTAVQIGDPFTQKRVIDFVLAARDEGLITGITDNGAGGLSSSVGEMATITGGASIDLSAVPLKYPGLVDWQIIVSESQERMTISTDRYPELLELGRTYNVEVSDIGEFHDRGYLEIKSGGNTVALLDLEFLHSGVPTLELSAVWELPSLPARNVEVSGTNAGLPFALLGLLAHPNIASREEVIRQYDHEVQGASVIKPLMGESGKAACDAAVIKPLLERPEGLVVSNGICPQWSAYDPYLMALFAVDEAVRNAVCVGVNPATISLLDNFSWPDPVKSDSNPDGDYKLGQLVRTCQGIYDACLAFNAPLISGKDSMKNDFDDGTCRLSILPTLLVSAIGKLDDAEQAVSMEFKQSGDSIYLLTAGSAAITGSHYGQMFAAACGGLPNFDSQVAPSLYKVIYELVRKEIVSSLHDLSEGGLAVAVAESAIGSGLGAEIDLGDILKKNGGTVVEALFAEGPSRILATVSESRRSQWDAIWSQHSELNCQRIGIVSQIPQVRVTTPGGDGAQEIIIELSVKELHDAWTTRLPF